MKKCSKCGELKPLEMFSKDRIHKDGHRAYCKECANKAARARREAYKAQNAERDPYADTTRTKQCRVCGKQKNVVDFFADKYQSDGLRSNCKECSAKYYADHKEEYKEWWQNYKETHKEDIEKYRAEHTEERRMKSREYYYEHKEECNKKSREYQRANKDKIREHNAEYRKSEHGKAIKKALEQKRRAAKKSNGGAFTADEWNALCSYFDNNCAYCGEKANLTADHIIPLSKGGSSDIKNILPVCQNCNSSKNAKDLTEWFMSKTFFTHERYNKILSYMGE